MLGPSGWKSPPSRLAWSSFISHKPTAKQLAFAFLTCREAFYGGAAGGGKSDALLMAALQYVDVPGYSALLLRRTYADLALPKALMDRAHEWLGGTSARWNAAEHSWTFPSGASLTFGYLDTEVAKYRYQSAEFQFVGFDELTQFTGSQYLYLFSRLRRLADVEVPLRMRSASNPGGLGHEWVRQRFIDQDIDKTGRVFIPASLDDNPHLDREAYVESLQELDPITRLQLLKGDWTARQAGNKFRREWFPIVEDVPAKGLSMARYWDLAATEAGHGDPDYTAGCLLGLHEGVWYIIDMKRVRATPGAVEALIKQTAQLDGVEVPVRMEQEPGSAGKSQVAHFARSVLVGHDFRGIPSTGSKEIRANPVSSAAEAGNIRLVRGPWVEAFLEELEAFPSGTHDDQVDALSGAFAELRRLTGQRRPQVHQYLRPAPGLPHPLYDPNDPKYRDEDRR